MLALGILPTALVTRYYGVLPNRFVIQWDTFGNTTVIGTRPSTVLMIANIGAVLALTATAIAIWQHRALLALRMRRAYLGLSIAQLVAINLTCAMIVGEALGLQLKIKPMVPPAMAVLLFAAGILCRRIDQSQNNRLARIAAIAFAAGGILFLALSAIAMNAVVGYYASALAMVAMVALALPQRDA